MTVAFFLNLCYHGDRTIPPMDGERRKDMTAEELWRTAGLAGSYESWSFGGDPDGLAELVLQGKKRATCSAALFYTLENEPLPQEGAYSVILDGQDRAVCIIRTTRVWRCRFCDVPVGHAWLEGEGDRSLAYWRQVHRDFFTGELAEVGLTFSEDLELICEEFERIWP